MPCPLPLPYLPERAPAGPCHAAAAAAAAAAGAAAAEPAAPAGPAGTSQSPAEAAWLRGIGPRGSSPPLRSVIIPHASPCHPPAHAPPLQAHASRPTHLPAPAPSQRGRGRARPSKHSRSVPNRTDRPSTARGQNRGGTQGWLPQVAASAAAHPNKPQRLCSSPTGYSNPRTAEMMLLRSYLHRRRPGGGVGCGGLEGD
jgi:hypothetical protein